MVFPSADQNGASARSESGTSAVCPVSSECTHRWIFPVLLSAAIIATRPPSGEIAGTLRELSLKRVPGGGSMRKLIGAGPGAAGRKKGDAATTAAVAATIALTTTALRSLFSDRRSV